MQPAVFQVSVFNIDNLGALDTYFRANSSLTGIAGLLGTGKGGQCKIIVIDSKTNTAKQITSAQYAATQAILNTAVALNVN